MFEEAEHFEFAKNTLRADERLKNVGHFFQGDTFTISWICHRPVFQKRKKNVLFSSRRAPTQFKI
jgi:hypothetical protein